ncbi:hypothetical protein DdX_01129 [Ditylenchus destructor]|uniref:Uncharacterized protein n=1 Tax=Ditylenchus destructor TaxID=166010 RepID=A0AAD4NL90_9BILA|nr:hypothetical protein DdX_01129 [Ditylenchus destructor]
MASAECAVEATAFQTALRLKLCDTNQNTARHFLCIANTHGAYLGWKNAFNLQILDSKIWADFASTQKNPHGNAISPPPSNVLSGLQRYFNEGNDRVQSQSQNHSSTLHVSNINRFSSLGKYDYKNTLSNTYVTVSEQSNPQIPQTSSVPYNYFRTASKTHYQKSPSVQRRQRRPIPIPEYFQVKEACTTFPAEDQPPSSDNTSVPENTYVISLRIGMDSSTPSTPAGATPRRFSCNSSSATANSSVHSTNRGGVSAPSSASSSRQHRTSVSFMPTSTDRTTWDTPPGGQERLLMGAPLLPRARLIGKTKEGKSTEDMISNDNVYRQGRLATVSRAETWHVPNSVIQCTRF